MAIGLERDVVRGEDLLSETLLKIFDRHRDAALDVAKRGKLDEYVRRSMYLMKIGKYTKFAIKYKRFASMWSCEVSADNIEPEVPFIGARLDNEYVDAYISMMPELDATVLRLYAMPDFKYDVVAAETGIPKLVLYKLVEKAIKKIRDNVQTKRPSTGQGAADPDRDPVPHRRPRRTYRRNRHGTFSRHDGGRPDNRSEPDPASRE